MFLIFGQNVFSQGISINKKFKLPIEVKGSISGKITDAKTGEALPDVSVYFNDIKTGTSTDSMGHYFIRNVPEGRHLIEISHIGYGSIIENIDVTGDTQHDFALNPTIIENATVIVTGVAGATQLKKVPFAVASIRRQELFQNTSSNIIESMTKIGGVSTMATGPAISKPVIRGLSYNRVLTINDGVRQEGQQWGDEHGIEVDEASVNRIELLKGPASIIYGSDAMAGVVNIVTNVPLPANTFKANISGNYQSNNHLRSFNVNAGANHNGFNWNIYNSNKAAADFRNKYDGRVFNSKFNEHNAGGYVGYNGNWGYSHLLLSSFDLKAGLVEGERDSSGRFIKEVPGGGVVAAAGDDFTTTAPFIPYQRIRHFKIASDNSIKMGKNRLSLNLGYQDNRREEFGYVDDPSERSLFFDLKTITYTAQFHLPEKNGLKTAFGINGMQQQNENKGVEQLIPDYKLFDLGAYIYSQKTLKKLTISGGIRFDSRQLDAADLLDGAVIKGNAFKKNFSNFSGSIGIAAQLTNKLNLKFNVARGFRAPSIPELASNGVHEGTIRYEYGDNSLKSETSLQFDGGIDLNAEHISLGLSAFFNSFTNFIFYRKLRSAAGGDSIITQNGVDLTAFKFAQRKAYLAGAELTVDIHPHPWDWLHVLNTFSFVSGKLNEAIEGSNNLPFIPAPKLVTELKVGFPKLVNGIGNFYTKLELDNTFSQNNVFTAYNTETATSGYSLLNAGIGTDIMNKKNQTLFSLAFSAINIGDVAYQNHLSRLKYAAVNLATGRTGVFNMGRNFSVKLNIPLGFKLKK